MTKFMFLFCLQNVLSWFSEFSDQQRNMMLMKILVSVNTNMSLPYVQMYVCMGEIVCVPFVCGVHV